MSNGNDNEQEEQYNTTNDDEDISIEVKSPEDTYVTINDISTVHEMNARQLNVNPETGYCPTP